MAGPYYVDITTASVAAWNTRNGLSSGACWFGMSGLQKAFDTAAAGEIVYIKGTGDLSKFYSVTFDASNGTTLTDGEQVSWTAGAQAGVVHCGNTSGGAGNVEITLIGASTAPVEDGVITGATSGGTITPTAAIAQKTIDVDLQTGSNAAGFIKFIGVNSSWAVDVTRAIIDANSVAVHIITFGATPQMIWMENIEVQEAGASSHGFYHNAGANVGTVYINCCAHNCGANGWLGTYIDYGLLLRCVSYSNTGHGIELGSATSRLMFCCSRDNGARGYQEIGSNDLLFGCISHNNVRGFCVFAGTMINCVSDDNAVAGVLLTANATQRFQLLIGNRITNHAGGGEIGVNASSEPIVTGWNYFENNDGDNVQNATLHFPISLEGTATTSNLEDLSNMDYGYVDSANHDFSTRYVDSGDPDLRRTAITVPWS